MGGHGDFQRSGTVVGMPDSKDQESQRQQQQTPAQPSQRLSNADALGSGDVCASGHAIRISAKNAENMGLTQPLGYGRLAEGHSKPSSVCPHLFGWLNILCLTLRTKGSW